MLSGFELYPRWVPLKEQCKEGEEGANKRSVGRIISLSGQG